MRPIIYSPHPKSVGFISELYGDDSVRIANVFVSKSRLGLPHFTPCPLTNLPSFVPCFDIALFPLYVPSECERQSIEESTVDLQV